MSEARQTEIQEAILVLLQSMETLQEATNTLLATTNELLDDIKTNTTTP